MVEYKIYANRDGVPCSVSKIEQGKTVMSIPVQPDNTDYQQYLKWLEEGNTPLPADPQPE